MQTGFWKISMFTLVVGGASFAGMANADADQCVRLDAHINHCSDYPPNQCPLLTDLTFTQQRTYWRKNLSVPGGEAELRNACKKYYDSISLEGTIATSPAVGGYAEGGDCYLDGSHHHVIDARIIHERERECDLVLKPDNPYRKLATGTYQRGGQFSHRASIIQANKDRNFPPPHLNPKVLTDVPDVDIYRVLKHTTTREEPTDDVFFPDPPFRVSSPQTADSYANIDHIIPRVDIHGCECGTNSPLNAAVISRVLNIGMSNNMKDMDRIEILRKFTNYNDIFGVP